VARTLFFHFKTGDAIMNPAGEKPKKAPGDGLKNSSQIELIKRLIRARGESLLQADNVTSVGIGFKKTGGVQTQTLAVQFSVDRKMSPEALTAKATAPLPPEIEFEGIKIPTDVVQRNFQPSYSVVALQNKSVRKTHLDPIRPGCSIAHITSTAGTLGAMARDSRSGETVLLSNWHVLSGAGGQPGDIIVQPGPFDDNQVDKNHVGQLLRSHLGLAGDCAVASVVQRKLSPEQIDLGVAVQKIGKPELGDVMVKSGRTTDVTYGRVSRVEALFKLSYSGMGEQTIGGFEIEPDPKHHAVGNEISKGGDSGSAWLAVDKRTGKTTNVMLGLHFGGDAEGSDGEFALACYAHSVFQKLEIEPLLAPHGKVIKPQIQATDAVMRTGFDEHFLGFKVAQPDFSNAVAKQLVGLAGENHINYCHFTVWLSKTRKLPVCVAWNIDGNQKKTIPRTGIAFTKDDREGIDKFQIGDELYSNNDFDRGHVARRDDLVWGTLAQARQGNLDSFYFTNMTPQHQAFNQSKLKGQWGLLENAILDEVKLRDLRISLMGGPVLGASDPKFRNVRIPREFWKAVFFTDEEDGTNKARAFILTQKDLLKEMQIESLELADFKWFQVPLATITKKTGVKFAASLNSIDTKFAQDLGPQARLVENGKFI
jgi:endonuclease G, mitochondrial